MRRAVVLGAVGALAVAAGCGGGGGNTLSKEEYGKQLNQICADYNAKVRKIGEPSTIGGLADKGPRLLVEFDAAVAKTEQLKPPGELKSTAEDFVSTSKELSAALGDLVDAAKKNDPAGLAQVGPKADSLNQTTKKLGLELNAPECAA